MSKRILVAEDEKKIAAHLQAALQKEGFQVELAHAGDAALAKICTGSFDVIVLDIMLPGLDGLEVLRRLRAQGIYTPVLVLSARGEVGERIEGLKSGADDYLPKPFVLAEAMARVHALARRKTEPFGAILQTADLILDPLKRTVRRQGRAIDLASKEYKLLEFLMRAGGQICSRASIIKNVWEYNFDPGTNLVDVYVMRLREKIDADFDRKLLRTIRGIGYVLKDENDNP